MKLENKKGIVTGAAKGMGAAITTTLARQGADLVLTARDTAALEDVAGEVRALGHEAHVIACDVTDEAQVAAMVAGAKEAFGGRIDILVNVAGVTGPIETPVQDIAVEDFDYVITANVRPWSKGAAARWSTSAAPPACAAIPCAPPTAPRNGRCAASPGRWRSRPAPTTST